MQRRSKTTKKASSTAKKGTPTRNVNGRRAPSTYGGRKQGGNPRRGVESSAAVSSMVARPDKVNVSVKDHGVYGPPMIVDHRSAVGDETVSFVAEVGNSQLPSAIAGLLSFASSKGGNAVIMYDMAFVYRFLCEYVVDEWTGKEHSYILSQAPSIFWDICDAGKPKRMGKFSYYTSGQLSVLQPSSLNTGNSPFGVVLSDASGYSTVDTSYSTYSEAEAYQITQLLFGDLGEALSCEARPLKPRIDDASAFVMMEEVNDSIGTYTCNSIVYKSYQNLMCPSKPKFPWITRLKLCPIACFAARHRLEGTCAPGAIVADRLLNRFPCTKKKGRTVIIKTFDAHSVMLARDVLVARADGIAAYTNSSSPWITVGMNFNDWKFMSYQLLNRVFSGWLCVGAGGNVWYDLGNKPLLRCGNGDFAVRGAESIHNFAVIEEAFRGLYPYEKYNGNRAYYTIPFFGADYTGGPVTVPTTGGILSSIWDWLDNLINGAEEACAFQNKYYYRLVQRWNRAIGYYQAYIPTCLRPDESKVNTACVTRMHESVTSKDNVTGFISDGKIPDHLYSVMERYITPECWTYGQDYNKQALQMSYGELFYEGYADEDGTGPGLTSDLYSGAWIDAVHVLGGYGDELANPVPDSSVTIEEEEEDKNYGFEDIVEKALPKNVRKQYVEAQKTVKRITSNPIVKVALQHGAPLVAKKILGA